MSYACPGGATRTDPGPAGSGPPVPRAAAWSAARGDPVSRDAPRLRPRRSTRRAGSPRRGHASTKAAAVTAAVVTAPVALMWGRFACVASSYLALAPFDLGQRLTRLLVAWIEAKRFSELANRISRRVQLRVRDAREVVELGSLRIETDGLEELARRFRQLSLRGQSPAKVVVIIRVVRPRAHGLPEFGNGFV